MEFPDCVVQDLAEAQRITLRAVCGVKLLELRRAAEFQIAQQGLAELTPDARVRNLGRTAPKLPILDEIQFDKCAHFPKARTIQVDAIAKVWGAFASQAIRVLASAIDSSFGQPEDRLVAFRLVGWRLSWWISSRLSGQLGFGWDDSFECLHPAAYHSKTNPSPPALLALQADWDDVAQKVAVAAWEVPPIDRALRVRQQRDAKTRRLALVRLFEQQKYRGKSWTWSHLAVKVGVDAALMYRYRDGLKNLSRETREAVAAVLGVAVSEIPE